MFTGIIEAIGTIQHIDSSGTNQTFQVISPISQHLKVDQSISHNGVCLTVEKCDSQSHTVTLIKETLDRSALGQAKVGDKLNLERCLRLSDRLDGHMVQGHVDAAIRCLNVVDQSGSWEFTFELPAAYRTLIVMKGSICVNGISLTVSALTSDTFSVSIIPYTYNETNMNELQLNQLVNVEFDVLGKYVERQMQFVDR